VVARHGLELPGGEGSYDLAGRLAVGRYQEGSVHVRV
jgi:hypothetical protein